MTNLLEEVLAAHGGLDNWRRVNAIPMQSAVSAAMAATPSAHAGDKLSAYDEECRAGLRNPIFGLWSGNLDFSTFGLATVRGTVTGSATKVKAGAGN